VILTFEHLHIFLLTFGVRPSTLVEWKGQRLGQRMTTLYRKNEKVKAI